MLYWRRMLEVLDRRQGSLAAPRRSSEGGDIRGDEGEGTIPKAGQRLMTHKPS
jgi:hypothetical protein